MNDGDGIVRANLILTAIFAATAAYAAVVFSTAAQWIGAVTAMSLFTIGVFVFLWSYWLAIQRSRTDEIAVSQLYLLLGPGIPTRVKLTMDLTLVAQFAIALVTAFARRTGPEGNPGSSLAVGFLVPMLGFGMNGLWAVTHGTFRPRADIPSDVPSDVASDVHSGVRADASSDVRQGDVTVTTTEHEIGQNADHG